MKKSFRLIWVIVAVVLINAYLPRLIDVPSWFPTLLSAIGGIALFGLMYRLERWLFKRRAQN